MTSTEWAALDAELRDDLLRALVKTSGRWDQHAYDSYELTVAGPRPPSRTVRKYVRMQTKRVRFVALCEPLGV